MSVPGREQPEHLSNALPHLKYFQLGDFLSQTSFLDTQCPQVAFCPMRCLFSLGAHADFWHLQHHLPWLIAPAWGYTLRRFLWNCSASISEITPSSGGETEK